MGRNSLIRFIFDPAIDAAAADSVAAFRARVILILILGPLLAIALSWGALLWGGAALALEAEAQVAFRRYLARGRLRRSDRIGVLARALVVTVAWASGPASLFVVAHGRFELTGMVWAGGILLYAAAFSFRAPAYAVISALPVTLIYIGAPFVVAERGHLSTIALFATFLTVNFGFAVHAAVVSHQRERALRRTRKKLIREAEAARRLAYHDQLTGLVNRRQLTQHLTQALAHADTHGDEVALLLIDLDRFKFVNDTYGHACGDELLREVARRLEQACRPGDICARLGGDEFVVLAPTCSAQDAGAIASRILKSLSEPMQLAATVVHTAASIGISLHAGGEGGDANLLRCADLALYRVKERGRNAFCFFETEMDQAVQSRRGLEADLREAIRGGAIDVVYQPQFDGDAMVGVEALARWTHPTRGAVPPSFFISLAEECGLIEELGMSIIRRAFADSWRWPDLRMAINLSPVQLRVPSFLKDLQLLLESSGVPAERIEFELTETILLADDVQTQHTLAALRGLGFGLALDDFGTGYSSLSYLRRFPIDRIKIDRSFVMGLPDDKVSDAVVRAVVRLGRSLGLKVVAEGVETAAQRRALASAGCQATQGYLMGRPVEAAQIRAVAWIDSAGQAATVHI